jgi:methyltransferase
VVVARIFGIANCHRTLVEVGLKEPVTIEDEIPDNTRVTLHFPSESTDNAEPVDPSAPRTEGGWYWGYSVRRCGGLSSVFTESPFEDGYDVSIGTSERGQPIQRAFPNGQRSLRFSHLLIVLGGPKGIEYAAGNDEGLSETLGKGSRARDLFDYWINVLPHQGSRTIRSEEALFIALTSLGSLWSMRYE